MIKLQELADMAKEISSKKWFLNADEEVTAIDNDAGPDDTEEAFIGCAANIQLAKYMVSANPEAILAIAEEFRALEQENILLKQGCENSPLVHEMIDWRERAEEAEAEVQRLNATAQPVSDGWVKCSERMPENSDAVLVCQEGGITFCAEYDGGEFYPDEFPNLPKQGKEITHWMPLPAAPGVQKNEQ